MDNYTICSWKMFSVHGLVCCWVDPFPHTAVALPPHGEESSLAVVGEIHSPPPSQTLDMSTGNEVLLSTAKVQDAVSTDGDGVARVILFWTHVRRPNFPAPNDDCVEH